MSPESAFSVKRQPRNGQPAQLRVGDAERQDAAEQLQTHYAQGRLTWSELDERLAGAWAARTRSDLTPLFSDLPPLAGAASAEPRTRFAGLGRPLDLRLALLVLALVAAVSMIVVTDGFILIPLAFLFFRGRRHHHRHDHRHDHRQDGSGPRFNVHDYPDRGKAWG